MFFSRTSREVYRHSATTPTRPLAVQIQRESVEGKPPKNYMSTQEVIRSVLLRVSAQVRVSLISCAGLTLSIRRRGSLLWLLWPLTTVGDSCTPQEITGLPRSHTTFCRLAFLSRLKPCFGLLFDIIIRKFSRLVKRDSNDRLVALSVK